MKLKMFTLEVSLKPFLRKGAPAMEEVCRKLFTQWAAATRDAGEIGVLLWTGDGSEMLEFSGDLTRRFDWSRYIGIINRTQTPEEAARDPQRRHAVNGHYFEEGTTPIDYEFLLRLVRTLKTVGAAVSGKEIRVGSAFDPGPEFAVSDFKYRKHPEICQGGYEFNRKEVVSCYSRLDADPAAYAGYPEGIPAGTPFGRFLGRQITAFLRAMTMDFIWFSNGFGFGNFPWNYFGVLFDDARFYPGRAHEVRAQMLEFWREFRRECHDPVMVRGSNLTTGRDLSCDGVPLREIYDGDYLVAPPVNSPWAALNLDFGSELAGWMSHLCGFPQPDFTFRLYVHDPWFPTKPWLHNYESEPYDIYLPLSVARLGRSGEVLTPSRYHILTVDDCHGELPDQAVEELTPHLNRARADLPDAPGPLVWLYPFDEYHRWIGPETGRIAEVFAGDHFIRDAINLGLPLNTVVSTTDCAAVPAGRVVITPVPEAGSHWEELVFRHVESGGDAMLYGPLQSAGRQLLDLLGMALTEPLDGELELRGDGLPECLAPRRAIRHEPLYSAGGISETGGKQVLFSVVSGREERTLAAEAVYGGGRLVWVRTSTARCNAFSVNDEYDGKAEREAFFAPAELLRSLLSRFGWHFDYVRRVRENWQPINAVSVCRGGFFFSGYNLTTTTGHRLKTPFGAPAMLGTDLELRGGFACYRQPVSWHRECRVFIEQQAESTVTCYESSSWLRGIGRWITVRGLRDASLKLFLEPGAEKTLEVQLEPSRHPVTQPCLTPFAVVEKDGYRYIEVAGPISGTVLIGW